ncbi:hypothetical protein HOG98_02365 [bacterium]|jgi:hypothetical protein|nr:hypothetical protein [bacterium]
MKSKLTHSVLKLALITLISTFTLSCSNAFDSLQKNYESGNYLNAADDLVEGLNDPELKPKILEFVQTDGEQLIEKALFIGSQSLKNDPSESTIFYFDHFVNVIESFILNDIHIPNMKATLETVEDSQKIAIGNYITIQYQIGLKNMDEDKYRLAITNFTNIKNYSDSYKRTNLYLNNAKQKAKRTISLLPFKNPNNAIAEAVANAVAEALTGNTNGTNVDLGLRIEDTNVIEEFNQDLYNNLDMKKSDFLTFTIDSLNEDISHSQYYIEGEITGEVLKNQERTLRKRGVLEYIPKRQENWVQGRFYYDEIIREFQIKVSINAAIYLTANDQKIQSFSYYSKIKEEKVQKTNPDHIYKNIPVRLPADIVMNPISLDTNEIVNRAINSTALKLSEEIISLIDRDNDPYLSY